MIKSSPWVFFRLDVNKTKNTIPHTASTHYLQTRKHYYYKDTLIEEFWFIAASEGLNPQHFFFLSCYYSMCKIWKNSEKLKIYTLGIQEVAGSCPGLARIDSEDHSQERSAGNVMHPLSLKNPWA